MSDALDVVFSREGFYSTEAKNAAGGKKGGKPAAGTGKKKVTAEQKTAIKTAQSQYKTMARTIAVGKAAKKNQKKSTEAKTITGGEKAACILITLFLWGIGGFIAWWLFIKNHDNEEAKVDTLLAVEIPSTIAEYNKASEGDKPTFLKLFNGQFNAVNKILKKFEDIKDRKDFVTTTKLKEPYKKAQEFHDKH